MYGKTLPFTGGALAIGALGYWTPVVIATASIAVGAALLRLARPIKRK